MDVTELREKKYNVFWGVMQMVSVIPERKI